MNAIAAYLDRLLTEHEAMQDAVAAERRDPTLEPLVGGWLTRPQIAHAELYPALGEPLAAQLYRQAREAARMIGMDAVAAVKELWQAHREYIDLSVGDRPDLLVEDRWCNAYAEVLSYVQDGPACGVNSEALDKWDLEILTTLASSKTTIKLYDLAEAVGLHRDTVSDRLKPLAADKLVLLHGTRKGWTITERGRQRLAQIPH